MDWTAWRDEFPILERSTYLATCSLAPLSRRVRAAIEHYLDRWDAMGAAAWYTDWLTGLDALRGKVGRILHADPDEITIAPSVSVALSSLASCFDYSTRNQVVTSALDFPTVPYQFLVKPRVDVRFVDTPDGLGIDPEAFAAAVSSKTAIVATSHVVFTSGFVQDVARIAAIARAAGAATVVDAYQSVGQMPVDVRALRVDALLTGGLKWLLGGTGIAFLYARRDFAESLRPTIAGWFGNARQFDFNAKVFEFRSSAGRFELGTPSVAAVAAASAGLDLVLQIGVDHIRDRTNEMTRDLIERADDSGFVVKTPREDSRRAGIVMLQMPDPGRAVEALVQERIIVDYRHDRLRASPYFFTTPEENQRLVDAAKRFL